MTTQQVEDRYGALGPQRQPFAIDLEQSSPVGWTLDQETLTPMNRELPQIPQFIKGAVFDLDGTLVNSEPYILRTILHTAERIIGDQTGDPDFRFTGHQVERIKDECFGRNDDEMSRQMLRFIQEHDLNEGILEVMTAEEFIPFFRQERQDEFISLCKRGEVKTVEGSIDLVMRAYEKYGPLALNTASPQVLAQVELEEVVGRELQERHGLSVDDVFPSHLRTYGDECGAHFGKPHPLGYIIASDKLSILPSRLIAFTDRPNDAQASLSAGYGRVVIIPENLDMTPFFVAGKHTLQSFFENLPEHNPLRDLDRVILTGNLSWLQFEK